MGEEGGAHILSVIESTQDNDVTDSLALTSSLRFACTIVVVIIVVLAVLVNVGMSVVGGGGYTQTCLKSCWYGSV